MKQMPGKQPDIFFLVHGLFLDAVQLQISSQNQTSPMCQQLPGI